ncbi:helix-turn-helix domain-containing protein [Myroides sp. N17-2]|uniref:helix-turn-helix domain-containing protein n=1 Tax=Myroides sp. N17-2 TaxID=2030799 RepID=UPI000EFD323D
MIIAERICNFFESNDYYLHPSFSIRQLCELLSIENTSIVHRVINNNLDTTFYKLVAKYRINYSLELLKSGNNWTLDVVANTSGFKSVNTFKKYFEEYIGLSPFLYRVNSF